LYRNGDYLAPTTHKLQVPRLSMVHSRQQLSRNSMTSAKMVTRKSQALKVSVGL
jgi:hypothetical protein